MAKDETGHAEELLNFKRFLKDGDRAAGEDFFKALDRGEAGHDDHVQIGLQVRGFFEEFLPRDVGEVEVEEHEVVGRFLEEVEGGVA